MQIRVPKICKRQSDAKPLIEILTGIPTVVYGFFAALTVAPCSFVDGVQPTFDAIADGRYPVSRPLFFYVKKAHVGVITGIQEYLVEFTSEKA